MKWLHFIFFIGVFWLSGLSYGQLSEKQIGRLDSLNTIITENKNDTSVARAYLELTEILYLTNFDTVIVLCQKAVDIAKRNLEKEDYEAWIELRGFKDDSGDLFHKYLKT